MFGPLQVIFHPISLHKSFFSALSDMVIKPNHKNVDGEGLVYLPYLFNWNFSSSNLRELVTIMCGVFGQEPPLFSRQTVQAVPVTPGASAYQLPPYPAPTGASYLQPFTASSSYPLPPARPTSVTSPYEKYLSPSIHATNPAPTYSATPTPLTGVSVPLPEHLKEQQAEREKERLLKEATSRLQEEILLTQTRIKGFSHLLLLFSNIL